MALDTRDRENRPTAISCMFRLLCVIAASFLTDCKEKPFGQSKAAAHECQAGRHLCRLDGVGRIYGQAEVSFVSSEAPNTELTVMLLPSAKSADFDTLKANAARNNKTVAFTATVDGYVVEGTEGISSLLVRSIDNITARPELLTVFDRRRSLEARRSNRIQPDNCPKSGKGHRGERDLLQVRNAPIWPRPPN